MALPIVMIGDIINVQIRGVLFGQVTITSLFYQYSSGTGSDIAQVATGFYSNWWIGGVGVRSAYAAAVSADWTFQQLIIQDVYPNRYQGILIDIVSFPGTAAAPALPSNSCAVIQRKTGKATKRKLKLSTGQLGCLHIPGVPDAAVTGDTITDTPYLNNLANLGSALIQTANLGTAGTALAVLFHARQSTPGADQLNLFAVDNDVRTMRRRTLSRGI